MFVVDLIISYTGNEDKQVTTFVIGIYWIVYDTLQKWTCGSSNTVDNCGLWSYWKTNHHKVPPQRSFRLKTINFNCLKRNKTLLSVLKPSQLTPQSSKCQQLQCWGHPPSLFLSFYFCEIFQVNTMVARHYIYIFRFESFHFKGILVCIRCSSPRISCETQFEEGLLCQSKEECKKPCDGSSRDGQRTVPDCSKSGM